MGKRDRKRPFGQAFAKKLWVDGDSEEGGVKFGKSGIGQLGYGVLGTILGFLDGKSIANFMMCSKELAEDDCAVVHADHAAKSTLKQLVGDEWMAEMEAKLEDRKRGSRLLAQIKEKEQIARVLRHANEALGLGLQKIASRLDENMNTWFKWPLLLHSSSKILFVETIDPESEPAIFTFEQTSELWAASKLDNPIAQRETAIILLTAPLPENDEDLQVCFCQGVFWLHRCAAYDNLAKSVLGSALSFPTEFKMGAVANDPDPGFVFQLFKEAAEAGFLDAQVNLGMICSGQFPSFHGEARFMFYDKQRAYDCWSKAAECKQPEGILNLGHMFSKGTGTGPASHPNPERAFKIWNELVRLGDPRGYYLVALCYKSGYGTAPNLNRARNYLHAILQMNPRPSIASQATTILRNIVSQS